jgi:hypothetical protein
MKRLLGVLGWTCRHRRYTWPVKRGEKHTVSCLDCGTTLEYDWSRMAISPRNGLGKLRHQRNNDNLTINSQKVLDKQSAIAL